MANRIQIVIAIIISVCGPLAVQCFSAGAPDAECVNMTPQHHVDPQKGPSPYNIIISKNTIHAGETIKVSIVGKTADDNFKGFIVQARVGESPVGTFDASPSRQYVQLLNCGSSRSNAITHKKITNPEGINKIEFNWTAPKDLSEKVAFRATIAKNGGVFWVQQKSETITVKA